MPYPPPHMCIFRNFRIMLFWLDSHAQLERSRNPLHLEDIALLGQHSPTFSYDIPKLNTIESSLNIDIAEPEFSSLSL